MHISFKLVFVLIILFFSLSFYPGFSQEQKDEMVLAKYQILQSKILEEDFTYLVDLPAGYEKTDKKYPVIYVMNSHITSTFANAVATLSQLSSEIIPQFILVGLCNDKGRASKYFPMKPNGELGEADTFLTFLTDEFIPYIDQNYRMENYRILMGQSNTGLFTVYSLLAKPTAFNAYIAASPSLGWCLDFIKEKAISFFAEGNWEIRSLYMNYGGKDYKDLCIDPIIEFAELLGEIAPKNFHWKMELLEQDGHVPIASLNNGLLWLFPDFWVSDEKIIF